MYFKVKCYIFIITLIISISHFSTLVYSQDIIDRSSKNKPDWLKETPKGQKYIYYSGMGASNNSLFNAKELAISSVLSEKSEEGTITIESKFYLEQSEKSITTNRKTEYELRNEVISEIIRTGQSIKIIGLKKEEEYWQTIRKGSSIEHQYWILMKIPKQANSGNDVKNELGYGLEPIWRSTLIPGWGQIYKKKKLKKEYLFQHLKVYQF